MSHLKLIIMVPDVWDPCHVIIPSPESRVLSCPPESLCRGSNSGSLHTFPRTLTGQLCGAALHVGFSPWGNWGSAQLFAEGPTAIKNHVEIYFWVSYSKSGWGFSFEFYYESFFHARHFIIGPRKTPLFLLFLSCFMSILSASHRHLPQCLL